MLRPLSGERAMLFEDELFKRSTTWKLSTSGLSAGLLFKGTGFGAAYEDGYGINCMYGSLDFEITTDYLVVDLAAPEMIKFGIESKLSSPLTSTELLKQAIVEALTEIQDVCSVPGIVDGHVVPSHL